MKSKKTDSQTAITWLNHDPQAKALFWEAQRNLQLEQLIQKTMNSPMAKVCKVAKIENQTLTIIVPSTVYSTRLRQIIPSLSQALRQERFVINDIKIKVQVNMNLEFKPLSVRKNTRRLNDTVQEHLNNLRDLLDKKTP